MRTHLAVLNQLQIPTPCPVPWDSMHGDDRVRYCDECQLNVYNLSAMTAQQAVDLVADREGRLCVSFYRRSDGMTVTADCRLGIGERVRRKWRRAVAVAASFVGFLGASGCTGPILGDEKAFPPGESKQAIEDTSFGQRTGGVLPPPPGSQ